MRNSICSARKWLLSDWPDLARESDGEDGQLLGKKEIARGRATRRPWATATNGSMAGLLGRWTRRGPLSCYSCYLKGGGRGESSRCGASEYLCTSCAAKISER